VPRNVVGHGHPGKLDDSALDGVHEGKVAHGPRKKRAFRVSRSSKEKGRGRQVNDAGFPDVAADGFEPANPHPRGLAVFLGFHPLVSGEPALFAFPRLLAIAVMRLIVDDEDPLHSHQFRHDPLEHLALGLQRRQLGTSSL